MAANEAAVAADMAAAPAPKKGGKKIWVVLFLVLVLAGGGGAAAWYFLLGGNAAGEGDEAAEAVRAPLHYVAIEPTFTVNLADKPALRFLQLQMEVSSRDPETVKLLETHMPAIRHNLLMLFGSKTSEDLRTREGKEQLQQAALEEIQRTLTTQGAGGEVESVLFTSFVMQ